jgi:hypothetical protein
LRVLVSDTSVIIDLERGSLLQDVFRLPFEFAVPDLLFRRELQGPLGAQLTALGLRVEELTPDEVTRATSVRRANLALSVPDAFAFSLATVRGWTLLTGDGGLRQLAVSTGLSVHGVLWLLDQLEIGRHVPSNRLHAGLTAISAHPRCRLPTADVKRRLSRYASKSKE